MLKKKKINLFIFKRDLVYVQTMFAVIHLSSNFALLK